MLIFGQKWYFLGPTILKIPQPNWHYYVAGNTQTAPMIFFTQTTIAPHIFDT